MKKRIVSLLGGLYFFGCGMLLFGVNAKAYIDPSVMTYLIQVIAGVAIAIGAGLTVHFRRAKKKINEKLGIDENRNKEVESDDIEFKEE